MIGRLVTAIPSAQAQTFTVLYTFTGLGDGAYPNGLVRDARGNLYGTTQQGGSFNYGTVFQLDTNGKEKVLHNFAAADGLNPGSTLILDGAGNLYGTTLYGGTPEGGGCSYGCGTLFKLDKSGKESVLYAFTGQGDGGVPFGDMARDAAGSVYGAMLDPFQSQSGGVFKVDRNGKETVLYQFTGKNDGGNPLGGVIRDKAGNLYGTTQFGVYSCSWNCGTVFKINRRGKESVLHGFTDVPDGAQPKGALVRDAEGNLYGTTYSGGNGSCGGGCGIVFKLNPGGKETILYNFTGPPDGKWPDWQSAGPGLVRDAAGNLYGTTQFGGAAGGCYGDGCGTVFKLDPSGHETVLHSFTGGADGSIPRGLILDAVGNLYGTTNNGGNNGGYCGRNYYSGCGVVFKLTP